MAIDVACLLTLYRFLLLIYLRYNNDQMRQDTSVDFFFRNKKKRWLHALMCFEQSLVHRYCLILKFANT